MIAKTIINGALIVSCLLGFAPAIATETPSFGVLACRGDCREPHAPGSPALDKEIELGVLDGLSYMPTRPLGGNSHFN